MAYSLFAIPNSLFIIPYSLFFCCVTVGNSNKNGTLLASFFINIRRVHIKISSFFQLFLIPFLLLSTQISENMSADESSSNANKKRKIDASLVGDNGKFLDHHYCHFGHLCLVNLYECSCLVGYFQYLYYSNNLTGVPFITPSLVSLSFSRT